MNPLPPLHVQTGNLAGDSGSLSTYNDEDEDEDENEHQSVGPALNFSQHSHGDHSLPNPEDHFGFAAASGIYNATPQLQHHQYITANATATSNTTTATPRHSNRTQALSNSVVVANAERLSTVANQNNTNNNNNSDTTNNQLLIRITTRPIMSWSPQVVHADGTSHTMTIDLPEEFISNRSIVITQQGWQDLYHLIVTAVAKNTSESILLFWFTGFLLMVMALILFFGVVRGIVPRLGILVGVLGFSSSCGIVHTVVRRFRVHNAVRRCVEECFYDHEAVVAPNASAINTLTEVLDIEQPLQQQQQQQQPNENIAVTGNDRIKTMNDVLDGLQELEDVANDLDGVESAAGGGFALALQQRLKSGDSSSHSRPNRQRLNTGGDSSVSSAMIFDTEDPRCNRAISRDGLYCVSWKWECLGMDAVVKISWE